MVFSFHWKINISVKINGISSKLGRIVSNTDTLSKHSEALIYRMNRPKNGKSVCSVSCVNMNSLNQFSWYYPSFCYIFCFVYFNVFPFFLGFLSPSLIQIPRNHCGWLLVGNVFNSGTHFIFFRTSFSYTFCYRKKIKIEKYIQDLMVANDSGSAWKSLTNKLVFWLQIYHRCSQHLQWAVWIRSVCYKSLWWLSIRKAQVIRFCWKCSH